MYLKKNYKTLLEYYFYIISIILIKIYFVLYNNCKNV